MVDVGGDDVVLRCTSRYTEHGKAGEPVVVPILSAAKLRHTILIGGVECLDTVDLPRSGTAIVGEPVALAMLAEGRVSSLNFELVTSDDDLGTRHEGVRGKAGPDRVLGDVRRAIKHEIDTDRTAVALHDEALRGIGARVTFEDERVATRERGGHREGGW